MGHRQEMIHPSEIGLEGNLLSLRIKGNYHLSVVPQLESTLSNTPHSGAVHSPEVYHLQSIGLPKDVIHPIES